MSKFFDYFQFAALVLFILLFSGKALYLRFSKGINTATVVAGKRGIQRAMEASFIIGLIVWINEVLLYSIHIGFRIFPGLLDIQFVNSTQAKLIGLMLITFGFVIYILALIALGDSWRMGIDNKAPGKLVTAGIFSVSRNPIYVFIDLYFTGTFLINGTLIFLIFVILTVAALHFQILQEERFLAKTYGQAYRDYCARTGRYITWKGT